MMTVDNLIQHLMVERTRCGSDAEVIVSFRVNGNDDQRSIADTDIFQAPNDPRHPWYFNIELEE